MSPALPKLALAATALLCLVGALTASTTRASEPPRAAERSRAPVLVELYTSEGCSSCPPADTLLEQLAREQPVEGARVVVLGFHVDYWNRLGWADPFSNPDFTERQGRANAALGRDGIFTPQAVVNGRLSRVANDASAMERAILDERPRPLADVGLTAKESVGKLELQARVAGAPAVADGDVAEVWAAITESGLSTDVRRGENAGRTLRHAPVVRKLVRLGVLPSAGSFSASIPMEPTWRRDRLQAVAFVQERRSGHVLGVAAESLSPNGARATP